MEEIRILDRDKGQGYENGRGKRNDEQVRLRRTGGMELGR